MKRCLFCYEPIHKQNPGLSDFHHTCSKLFFREPEPPELPWSTENIDKLATKIVRSRFTVTGVQPKLSLDIARTLGNMGAASKISSGSRASKARTRLTIVDVPGNYILKPPSGLYPHLPENEHLCMRLAGLAGINVVPNTLIKMKDGVLAYLTRRIDRTEFQSKTKTVVEKLHMEDMCQLTNRLTENKYKGSYEKIGKTIKEFSANPLLDVINFYEQVLFSFLTGNADMHLKNFSLIQDPRFVDSRTGYVLSPAYDMVSTALVIKDDEELALTLSGKKKKITRDDFEKALSEIGVYPKSVENIFNKFSAIIPVWQNCIQKSFLPKRKQTQLISIIHERATVLNL